MTEGSKRARGSSASARRRSWTEDAEKTTERRDAVIVDRAWETADVTPDVEAKDAVALGTTGGDDVDALIAAAGMDATGGRGEGGDGSDAGVARGAKRARGASEDGEDDDDDDGEDGERGSGLEEYDDVLLLPRRTKVVISGNNRTKGKLVGMRAVVKKAVGLGGWHWLVLDNGQEVRLQRNALTVVEAPESQDGDGEDADDGEGDGEDIENGEDGEEEEEDGDDDEDDDDDDDDDSKDNMKTRLRRPTRIPGNGPPSQAAAAAMKRLQERRRSARPNCMSNFERLTLTTLLKYKKMYGLEPNAETDSDKTALTHEIAKHFMSQKLDEQKVLQDFMCAVADTTQVRPVG